MTTANATAFVVEIPPAGRGTPPWEDRREWVPVHFEDSELGWRVATETRQGAPTVFSEQEEAERALRRVRHRLEVLVATGKTYPGGQPNAAAVLGAFKDARTAHAEGSGPQ